MTEYTKSGQVLKCTHCGENCAEEAILANEKSFCCEGCKLVYEILDENNLCTYYSLNSSPGISQKNQSKGRYGYLRDSTLSKKLISFSDGQKTTVNFRVPQVHCSSCIWLLEKMPKLNKGIISSRVNFLKKEVSVLFSEKEIHLADVAELLANIGYPPEINLADEQTKVQKKDYSRWYKIGVAGFCFGNIMLLSFPEYLTGKSVLEPSFKLLFGYLNILLSLPVFFYSASEFFKSAFYSLRQKFINIDVPIALGIAVMFVRSVVEIVLQTGPGYMDSMAALVFLMLVGRWFQNQTYHTLSFERDYKSYFPVAVTLLKKEEEQSIPLSKLKVGDRILVRNNEIVPADSLLVSGDAAIDYSFVTGESEPVKIVKGSTVFAGGKQCGSAIKVEVIKNVSQSYLTELWNNEIFSAKEKDKHEPLINTISKYFTIAIILIAIGSALWWLPSNPHKALDAFTAVLIIACPCALALSSPFTLGHIVRVFGRNGFYLKNAAVVERIAQITDLVFDKTGTITVAGGSQIVYEGANLNNEELLVLKSLFSQSSHPLSTAISQRIDVNGRTEIDSFSELPGKGIKGRAGEMEIKAGAADFAGTVDNGNVKSSRVYININGKYKGVFSLTIQYREGLKEMLSTLSGVYKLALVSGDNASEENTLRGVFPSGSVLRFNYSPQDKLDFIKQLQSNKRKVLMVGDGLNDAGALKQSDTGISVSNNLNNFSPACDAILEGSNFHKLPVLISFAKKSSVIIGISLVISLLYNAVGLSFAVQGLLSPVFAAVLMPLSSITVVAFVTMSVRVMAGKSGL
ncbi:MAG: Copper-exporting P-type ATPase [Bacteroidia bacterium]|nr:Copper-exporting P-type ATPase [Bacteroidia bacterium]